MPSNLSISKNENDRNENEINMNENENLQHTDESISFWNDSNSKRGRIYNNNTVPSPHILPNTSQSIELHDLPLENISSTSSSHMNDNNDSSKEQEQNSSPTEIDSENISLSDSEIKNITDKSFSVIDAPSSSSSSTSSSSNNSINTSLVDRNESDVLSDTGILIDVINNSSTLRYAHLIDIFGFDCLLCSCL